MLKTIVKQSPKLAGFVLALELALFQPQMQHLTCILDSLIVCDTRKTLCNLYRQWVDDLDPKAAADFFRESPWLVVDLSTPRQRFIVRYLLELVEKFPKFLPLIVSVDDSLGKKHKATRHLQGVDFQHNHTESTRQKAVYTNGFVYVETHIQLGPFGFLFDIQLYAREKTIRRLNRERDDSQDPVHYRSKYRIARAMLTEVAALLPKDIPVIVAFDSWYASAKLINFCRRQKWQVICALKSNRLLNNQRVDHHDQTLRHKHYTRVEWRVAGNPKPRLYYVRSICGQVTDVSGDVCVFISRRHPGAKRPKYFLCTDLTWSAQKALSYYQKRWAVEVDNWYLKEALGLSDFRLQQFESIEKWFAVVVTAINFLQYCQAQDYVQSSTERSLSDFIRRHRLEHAQEVVRAIATQVLQRGDIEATLARFIIPDAVT